MRRLLRLVRRQRDDGDDALDAVVVGLGVILLLGILFIPNPDLPFVLLHVRGLVVRVQVVRLGVEYLEALHPHRGRSRLRDLLRVRLRVPVSRMHDRLPDAADAPPDDAHVLAEQQRAQVGPVSGGLLLGEERVVADDGVLESGREDSLILA